LTGGLGGTDLIPHPLLPSPLCVPAELAAIDAWIASSSDKKLTRAHAIRRPVELGLKVKK
jgi:hypothetical protein